MRFALFFVRLSLSAGCAGALLGCVELTPGGRTVTLTGTVTDVRDCRTVGAVRDREGIGPWKTRLRNEAATLGADTVYTTGPGLGFAEGVAYDCARP